MPPPIERVSVLPAPAAARPSAPSQNALQRAGAHLALLHATLIACTRPYTRFEIRGRQGGLILHAITPDGQISRHNIGIPGLEGHPSLPAMASHLNVITLDRVTGRRGLIAPRALGRSGGSGAQELVTCAACFIPGPDGDADGVLHLALPLVVRRHADGRFEVFRPTPAKSPLEIDLDHWADF